MSERTELDCRAAMRQLYDYLDHELQPDQAEAVRSHIERCKPCFAHASFEQDLLAVIADGWKNVGASSELRTRILRELQSGG